VQPLVSGIAQTWTLNIAIVSSNLGALIYRKQGSGVNPENASTNSTTTIGMKKGWNWMVNYWERMGLLGPIYRLIGRGLNDNEIAAQLKITEVNVRGCIAWLTHFLNCSNRTELVVYAAGSLPTRLHPRAA